ncbi:MAG: PAS domain-containing protein [Planctomycetes bacterium]|nr:PAS domain-containing protein [Planctomycetota bacterium]
MAHSRFSGKLYAGYVVLILTATSLVGFLVAHRIARDSEEQLERSLRAKAAFLRDIASAALLNPSSPGGELQERIKRLGRETESRLTVIAADGTVLADSDDDPARMDNHAKRPEVIEAQTHEDGKATRISRTVGASMVYLAQAVRAPDGSICGYVRTALPLTEVEGRLADLRGRVIFGAFTAALIALILGFVVAHRITGPVTRLTRMVESLAAGDYSQKVPTQSRDEIGELALAVNAMASQLNERMQIILTDRNKLAAVLASMAEGVVAVDRDERVVHLNEAARKILRLGPADWVGHKIWEVTRTREVCESLSEAMGRNAELERELRLVTPPRDVFVKLHASPLRDSDGKLAGAVVILEDVSDLRRLEEVRRDFVANVSHELKTPLTAIRGLVETLIEEPEMERDTRVRFLDKVHRQTMRLSQIVTDLLTLSRAEAQDGALEREVLDLREPIRDSARNLRITAEEKKIALSIEGCAEPLPLKGDYEAFRQAIDNLLDNAIKYTPAGGSVWVRAKRDGDDALVEVQDTGIGIDPMHQERIFERFYRVDKARSRELGGTGLGLSIVKHIAMALGGSVSVESFPGRGSHFRIRLPLALNATNELEQKAPTSEAASQEA